MDKENVDLDELTANLVHEMFHGFQYIRGETRYPNELKLLDYPLDSGHYHVKFVELSYLKKVNARETFTDYLAIKSARVNDETSIDEFKVETIEGMLSMRA